MQICPSAAVQVPVPSPLVSSWKENLPAGRIRDDAVAGRQCVLEGAAGEGLVNLGLGQGANRLGFGPVLLSGPLTIAISLVLGPVQAATANKAAANVSGPVHRNAIPERPLLYRASFTVTVFPQECG